MTQGQPRIREMGEALTELEVKTVELVAGGHTDAEIAGLLFVSERTAKNHIQRARTKLGAVNRAHMVTRAYQTGVLSLPGTDSPYTLESLVRKVALNMGYELRPLSGRD